MIDLFIFAILSNYSMLNNEHPSICIIPPLDEDIKFYERDILTITLNSVYDWEDSLSLYTNSTDDRWAFDVHILKKDAWWCDITIHYKTFILSDLNAKGTTNRDFPKEINISTEHLVLKTVDGGFFPVSKHLTSDELKSVIEHELGHALGLDHDNRSYSIMVPSLEVGSKIISQNVRDVVRLYGENGFQSDPNIYITDLLKYYKWLDVHSVQPHSVK